MNSYLSRHFAMRLLMVAAAFFVGWLLYDKLPDPMPTHWGIDGQVDGWSPKASGAWLIPGLALFMLLFFPLLEKIDPRKKNYPKFKPGWELFQTVMIGFLIYVYNLQLYAALNPASSAFMGKGVMGAVGALFIVIGLIMPTIESNYFIGIRTPWTLEDKTVWKKTHVLGGKMFMLAGALFIAAIFCGKYLFPIMIAAILISALTPVVYSYLISRK